MATDKGLEEISESTWFLAVCLASAVWRMWRFRLADGKSFTAQIESNYDEVTDSFDNMNLKAELLRGE